MNEVLKKFVTSRGKLSVKSSIKVDDLFFTPNCENVKEYLSEIVEITEKNFPGLIELNRKTATSLCHIFGGDDTLTKFYMAALTLCVIKGKKFSIINDSKIGSYIQVKNAVENIVSEEGSSEELDKAKEEAAKLEAEEAEKLEAEKLAEEKAREEAEKLEAEKLAEEKAKLEAEEATKAETAKTTETIDKKKNVAKSVDKV